MDECLPGDVCDSDSSTDVAGVTLADNEAHRALSVGGGRMNINTSRDAHVSLFELHTRFAPDPFRYALIRAGQIIREGIPRPYSPSWLATGIATPKQRKHSLNQLSDTDDVGLSLSWTDTLMMGRLGEKTCETALGKLMLGLSCLHAVSEDDVFKVSSQFEQTPIQGNKVFSFESFETAESAFLPTKEMARQILQELRDYYPQRVRSVLAELSSIPCGRELITVLYYGVWNATDKHWAYWGLSSVFRDPRGFTSLLDPRAFLQEAHGRRLVSTIYHFILLILLACAFYFEHPFTSFCAAIDLPLLAFLIGGIVEESYELWGDSEYLGKVWNRLDCGVMICLVFYFSWMGVDQISRAALAFATCLQMLRLLGCFQSVRGAAMLIRTTFAMLGSVSGFLMFYMFVILAFTFCLFLLYHTEQSSLLENVGRLHAHGASEAEGDDEYVPFQSLSGTFIWLFGASLGSFDFYEVERSTYAECGTILLVIWLLSANVVLLNFLVAILSKTYEDHSSASEELYLVDIGTDALEPLYEDDPWIVPWLPRPANLVNLVVTLVLKFMASLCCRRHAVSWGAIHLRTQLGCFWLFGNVVVVVSYLAARVVMLALLAVAVVLLSPITTSCCIVNLLNGSIIQKWDGSMQKQVSENEPRQRMSTRTGRTRAFLGELTTSQTVVLISPAISVLLSVLWYFQAHFVYFRRYTPWSALTFALEDLVPPMLIRNTVIFRIIADLVLCLTFFLSLMQLRMLIGLFDGTVCQGMQALLRKAGMGEEQMAPDMHSSSADTEQMAADVHLQTAPSWAAEQDDLRRETTYMHRLNGEQSLSSRKVLRRLSITSFMRVFLEPSSGIKRLLCSAVDYIYREGLQLCFRDMAYYLKIEDWYWIACSVVWCVEMAEGEDTEEFRLMDRELAPLKPAMRLRLLSHPQFRLYCTIAEQDCAYVFFEDFFWAVYQGWFGLRHISIEVLLTRMRDTKSGEPCQKQEDHDARVSKVQL